MRIKFRKRYYGAASLELEPGCLQSQNIVDQLSWIFCSFRPLFSTCDFLRLKNGSSLPEKRKASSRYASSV